jgi:hypothetical protein
MRPILTALLLLIITATCRAEYEAAGDASAKPKSIGATFGDGMASKRPAAKNPYTILDHLDVKNVAAPFVGFAIPIEFSDSATRRVRTPRTHRPANIPSLPYVESFISCDYGSSISIFVPAK